MSNFGDDLFCLTCSLGASRYWSGVKACILAPPIPEVMAHFSVPRILGGNRYASLGMGGKALRLYFAVREALRSDFMIFAGGSVFGGQGGVRGAIERVAGVTELGFAGLGVSIGPFASTEDERQVRKFLQKFQYLTVRDKASFEWAKQIDLTCKTLYAGDLVGALPLLLPDEGRRPGWERNKILGISLCNYESVVGGDQKIEAIRNAALINGIVDFAKARDLMVDLFVLNGNATVGDEKLANHLLQKLKSHRIPYRWSQYLSLGLNETLRRISEAEAFLSVRLHGAIAAYLTGTPFCLVEYHRKCSDFLDDIGQHNRLRLGARITKGTEVFEVLETMFSKDVPPKISAQEYAQMAESHFTEAPWMDLKSHLGKTDVL